MFRTLRIRVVTNTPLLSAGIKSMLSSYNHIQVSTYNTANLAEVDTAASEDVWLVTPEVILDAKDQIGPAGIVYGYPDNADVFMQAVSSGFKGYVASTASKDTLYNAFKAVYNGEECYPECYSEAKPWTLHDLLSPRLVEYCSYFVQDRSADEIADAMSLTVESVHQYHHRVKQKLGIQQNYTLYAYLVAAFDQSVSYA